MDVDNNNAHFLTQPLRRVHEWRCLTQHIGCYIPISRRLNHWPQDMLDAKTGVTFQHIQKYKRGTIDASPWLHCLRRKLLHVITCLQRIKNRNSAAFAALCKFVRIGSYTNSYT